jgi:hypothetical protein
LADSGSVVRVFRLLGASGRFGVLGCRRGDRLHKAGDEVVDVSGDGDPWGDGGRGAEELDVVRDCRGGVEDRVLLQVRLVGSDPLGVPAAEAVVGERAGSALGVVDHGDLEQRAVREVL